VASSLQGEPRATNDIDFVVSLAPRHVGELVTALGEDFEVDADMLREALGRGTTANFFYLPLVTKIDVFGLGGSPFDEAEFARRKRVPVRRAGDALFREEPQRHRAAQAALVSRGGLGIRQTMA
jgi:hypothetical protein